MSKKNALGRKHGFLDEAQGTLFFDVARILKAHRPRAFLLENVKNLKSHDKGRTFEVIRKILEKDLGYELHVRVLNARHFLPQNRERIVLVGFREKSGFDWADLKLPVEGEARMRSVLHPENGSEIAESHYTEGELATVSAKYTLSNHLWKYLRDYSAKHRAAGNGFGYGLVGPDDTCRTLSARYYKDGSEILVQQKGRKNPRRLTPRECARLMGFPDTFRIPVSDTQAYKQFGNSVAVPVFSEVATFDAVTGQELTFRPLDDIDYQAGGMVALEDDTVLAGQDGELSIIDPTTGSREVVATIRLANIDGLARDLDGSFVAIDGRSGTLVWFEL